MIFKKVFGVDRTNIATLENIDSEICPNYVPTSGQAYAFEEDETLEEKQSADLPLPPIPTLSIGASVWYIKDDHVEVGTLVGVDMSNPSIPAKFDVEFKDGRKVQATRENIELADTPDSFSIPTKARKILEVASTIPKETLETLMNPEVLTPLK